jgi:hypothetical protein
MPVEDTTDQEELMRRYLLGDLSEAAQQEVEKRFFEDDGYYGRLQIVEEELVDRYVGGELPGEEQKKFEVRFLSTRGGRMRVAFARALMETLQSGSGEEMVPREAPAVPHWKPFPPSPRLQNLIRRVALVCAVLAVSVGVVWLTFETARLRGLVSIEQARRDELQRELVRDRQERVSLREELNRIRQFTEAEHARLQQGVTQERARRDRLTEELRVALDKTSRLESELKSVLDSAVAVSFLLSPVLRGSPGEVRRLVVPFEAATIRFEVDLEAIPDYPRLVVSLRRRSGEEVWSQTVGREDVSNQAVTVALPARILGEGAHEFLLSGVESAGTYETLSSYPFTIVSSR